MGRKTRAAGLAAAAAALSCMATQADAAACVLTNSFTDYFTGGPNANCSIGDATILANSWNPVGQSSGLETTNLFTTPSNNPGIEFFINTILGAANGASFTFTVSALAGWTFSALTFSSNTESTVAAFNVTANSSSQSVTGTGSLDFPVSPADSVQITMAVTDPENDPNGDFDYNTASVTYSFTEVPAPEPTSLALIGVGLSAAGLTKARRRKLRAG